MANLGQYAQANQLGSITGTQLPAQVSYRPPAQPAPNAASYQAAGALGQAAPNASAYQAAPARPTVTTSGFGASQPGQSYGSKFPATPQYSAAQAQPAPGYAQALQSLLNARRPQGMAQQGFAPSAYGGNGNAANSLQQQNALAQQQYALGAQRRY